MERVSKPDLESQLGLKASQAFRSAPIHATYGLPFRLVAAGFILVLVVLMAVRKFDHHHQDMHSTHTFREIRLKSRHDLDTS